jgi:hypothetical protein
MYRPEPLKLRQRISREAGDFVSDYHQFKPEANKRNLEVSRKSSARIRAPGNYHPRRRAELTRVEWEIAWISVSN